MSLVGSPVCAVDGEVSAVQSTAPLRKDNQKPRPGAVLSLSMADFNLCPVTVRNHNRRFMAFWGTPELAIDGRRPSGCGTFICHSLVSSVCSCVTMIGTCDSY